MDDMPAIHENFRKILLAPTASGLDEVEDALFGTSKKPSAPRFTLDSTYQGKEAMAKVCASLQADCPYALAFVDMRMSPGWDVVTTIEHLWSKDPHLQIVICTAYADYSCDEVLGTVDARDRLLILKPFDPIEVCQLSSTLTEKWEMTRQAASQLSRLEEAVQGHTLEISQTNQTLQAEIAERKNLEGQLVQSEKLASIGQLAAGVVHEIDDPIGFIFSNFGVLEKYLCKPFEMLDTYQKSENSIGESEVATMLKRLRARVELDYLREEIPVLMRESKDSLVRVRQIVRDLKDFSRADASLEWQSVHLHPGIDSTLNIVASEIKYATEVIKEHGTLPDIVCLPTQLNQVVLNLVVNAAHAMGMERGRIVIRTDTADASVWFEVEDTGFGIPPEALTRMFDPFFHDRARGKGNRSGAVVGIRDRAEAPWPHRRAKRGGKGYDLSRAAARAPAIVKSQRESFGAVICSAMGMRNQISSASCA